MFVCTLVSEFASCSGFEFCTFWETCHYFDVFPVCQLPFLKLIQGSVIAFLDGLLPEIYGLPFALTVITTISVTFRISVW